jgi:actin-like ATPase involved in cell morphogenesis
VFVAGSPWSAEALLAEVLKAVIAQMTAVEAAPPTRLVLTHPANWGTFKQEQFAQVPRLADVDVSVALVAEPVAAALHYAAVERVATGSMVAVYDLGGGTFDATLLRIGEHGPEVLGAPEGIERLGGIDFDAAVFEHVRQHCDTLFDGLDMEDDLVRSAVAQVRASCRVAKETLSEDSIASVMVALPSGMTNIRITRGELEDIIRPQIAQSVAALRRALRSAGLDVADVDRVLLVGGSSRVPLVAQMLASELGRPLAVDASPKHVVALGAARFARQHTGTPASAPPPPVVEVVVEAPPAVAPLGPDVPQAEVSHAAAPAVERARRARARGAGPPTAQWCALCHTEYNGDAARCADCWVPLVESKPLTMEAVGDAEGRQLLYEFDDVSAQTRYEIERAVAAIGIAHAWSDRTGLVVSPTDEEAVDETLQLVDRSYIDPSEGEAAGTIIYSVADWDEPAHQWFRDLLVRQGIAHRVTRNNDVALHATDESRADVVQIYALVSLLVTRRTDQWLTPLTATLPPFIEHLDDEDAPETVALANAADELRDAIEFIASASDPETQQAAATFRDLLTAYAASNDLELS